MLAGWMVSCAAGQESGQATPPILSAGPTPELERPTTWGEPTEVQVGIFVLDVDELNSADQSFAASVYYEVRWQSPSLRHEGPGPMHRGLTEIWNPHPAISSLQMAWKAFPESVEIQPDGTVVYRQKVWGRFSQPLELQDFPFDQQELSIHLVAAGLMQEDVKIVPLEREHGRQSGIAERFSLPDFDVVSWTGEPTPFFPFPGEVGVAGFEMKLKVRRRATYFAIKIIVPLCLIVVMSWLPRWIDPEQAGTNIGLSTSAFLTLVAYLFAVTVLLPRVSYITRLDRFILLATLMVFAGLIQTVSNSVRLKAHKKALVERMEWRSRWLYPLLLIAILIVSFVL